MSNSTHRVLISCAVISLALIACICIAGLAGIVVFTLSPITAIEQSASTEPVESITTIPETQPGATDQPTTEATLGPDMAIHTPTPAPTPESALPIEIMTQMETIQAQVTELRGLRPLEFVDLTLLSPEQLRERVMNDFLEDYSLEDARDDVLVLSAFGLLDPQFDLYDLYIELYSEQIVGYYDSETKEMFVIQGTGFSGPERLTYAHEYTHALQDQHYQIEEELLFEQDYCETNTEYCAAVQALLEGDASLVEMEWLYNHATNQDIREIQEFYTNYESPVFETAPSFLRADFLFPYLYGQAFVETIYDAGGWAAVDQVYENPPLSTEQILHPDRYPNVVPILVELPDYLTVLEGNWRELDRNILGEWYTYLVLAEALNEEARLDQALAQQAADGWAGDSYVVYHSDETNQTILVLQTAWKSENEASQFREAFLDYANTRFTTQTSSSNESWSWESEQGFSAFYLNGMVTTWIIAPDSDVAEWVYENLETR